MNQGRVCLLIGFLKTSSAEPMSFALSPVRRERRWVHPAISSHWSTRVFAQLPLCPSLTGKSTGSGLIRSGSRHLVCTPDRRVQPLPPQSSPLPLSPFTPIRKCVEWSCSISLPPSSRSNIVLALLILSLKCFLSQSIPFCSTETEPYRITQNHCHCPLLLSGPLFLPLPLDY